MSKVMQKAKRNDYIIQINGFTTATFTKCDWPEMEMELSKFAACGSIVDEIQIGRGKLNQIDIEQCVLTKGSPSAALEWFKKGVNMVLGQLTENDEHMMDIEISIVDVKQNPVITATLIDAFCYRVKMDKLDSGNSDPLISSMGVAYNGLRFTYYDQPFNSSKDSEPFGNTNALEGLIID